MNKNTKDFDNALVVNICVNNDREAALDEAGSERMDIVFCGGAGEELMQVVGRPGQWVPDLVFEGLAIMANQGRTDV